MIVQEVARDPGKREIQDTHELEIWDIHELMGDGESMVVPN